MDRFFELKENFDINEGFNKELDEELIDEEPSNTNNNQSNSFTLEDLGPEEVEENVDLKDFNFSLFKETKQKENKEFNNMNLEALKSLREELVNLNHSNSLDEEENKGRSR